MTDHRCDVHARIYDLYDREVRGAVTRCDLFLGHEGDHRVLLTWPDPVAAAEDAAWSAERNDPDETFDVDVPIESGPSGKITPRSCGNRWDNQLGEPFDCPRALGHDGPHYRDDGAEPGDREHAVAYTSEDIDRVRRERLGEVCNAPHPTLVDPRCTWGSNHYGSHTDGRGLLW